MQIPSRVYLFLYCLSAILTSCYAGEDEPTTVSSSELNAKKEELAPCADSTTLEMIGKATDLYCQRTGKRKRDPVQVSPHVIEYMMYRIEELTVANKRLKLKNDKLDLQNDNLCQENERLCLCSQKLFISNKLLANGNASLIRENEILHWRCIYGPGYASVPYDGLPFSD